MLSHSTSNQKSRLRQNKGQIVVEYVLLMLVAVAVAAILVSGLVSRDPDRTGAVIRAWSSLIDFVSQDRSDDVIP